MCVCVADAVVLCYGVGVCDLDSEILDSVIFTDVPLHLKNLPATTGHINPAIRCVCVCVFEQVSHCSTHLVHPHLNVCCSNTSLVMREITLDYLIQPATYALRKCAKQTYRYPT